MSGHDDALDARRRQVEAEDRALREAMIESASIVLLEFDCMGDEGPVYRDQAEAVLQDAGALDLAAAVQALLRRHDDEFPGAAFEPDAGCIECTSGATPDRFNTGPCPHHRIKAILGRLKA